MMTAYGQEQNVLAKTPLRRAFTRAFGTHDLGARVRYAAVQRALAGLAQRPPSVLDAGCGLGALCFAMRRRWPSARIVGVDADHELVERCAALQADIAPAEPIRFECCTLPLDLGERFMLVTCIDVLEHVADDAGFLGSLAAMSAPGGTLILHTPAATKRRFFAEFPEQHDHVRTGYSAEGLAALLHQAGFTDVRLRFTFGPAGALAWEGFTFARRGGRLALAGLPAWYALAALDGMHDHATGNGLLAVAVRGG